MKRPSSSLQNDVQPTIQAHPPDHRKTARKHKKKNTPCSNSDHLQDVSMDAQSSSVPNVPLGRSTSNYNTTLSVRTSSAYTVSSGSEPAVCIAEKSPLFSQLQYFRGDVLVPQQSVPWPFFFFTSIVFDETFQVFSLLLAHWQRIDISFSFSQLHGIMGPFNETFSNSLNLTREWLQCFSNFIRSWWGPREGFRKVRDRIFLIEVMGVVD